MRPLARALSGLAALALAGAPGARAQEPPRVGGEVASELGLALGQPATLTPTRRSHGARIFTATIAVEATATEAPTRLSIADGEALAGARHGHLTNGASILRAPLQAAAGHGRYSSLAARAEPLLKLWNQPLAATAATIRLRQSAGPNTVSLRSYQKLLLVTLSATGP